MIFPIRFIYAIIYLVFGITAIVFSFSEKICIDSNSWNFNINDYLLGLGILLLISFFFFVFFKKSNNNYININENEINNNYYIFILILFCVNFVWFISGLYIFYNNLKCIKDNIYEVHGLKLLVFHLFKLIHLFVSYEK